MKKKNIVKIYSAIPFLPLVAFVYSYKVTNDWKVPFILGGFLAVLQIIIFMIAKLKLEKFILAVNLFLVGGAAMEIFNIGFLGYLYGTLLQTTLFAWLFVVGLFATFFSENGFVGSEFCSTLRNRVFSLVLLVGVGVAAIISFYFKGDMLLGGALPFISLVILKKILQRFCEK